MTGTRDESRAPGVSFFFFVVLISIYFKVDYVYAYTQQTLFPPRPPRPTLLSSPTTTPAPI